MYKRFFELKANPFNVNPDPRYLFLTKQIEETLSSLMYGIQTRKGIVTLAGEVGTGKTTLVNRLLDWLHQNAAKTAFLFNSRMNSSQFFDFVLAEFGIRCESSSKSQQLIKLNQWLVERFRAGETCVLIIDEAQNLTFAVLEEIRMLTNLETYTEKLLQIVLSKFASAKTAATTHHDSLQDRPSNEGRDALLRPRKVENRRSSGERAAYFQSGRQGRHTPVFTGGSSCSEPAV